jgi:hypothetical protein
MLLPYSTEQCSFSTNSFPETRFCFNMEHAGDSLSWWDVSLFNNICSMTFDMSCSHYVDHFYAESVSMQHVHETTSLCMR